jgi:HD-like signal output (HDOD) protein
MIAIAISTQPEDRVVSSNVLKRLFGKGKPPVDPGPEVSPTAQTTRQPTGRLPTAESLTMTSMLDAQISDLGGPMEELDPEMWADLAERVASLANDMPALPAFPGVATRVLSMARDPNLDVNKLCTEVQRDAGIASTLLRVANSAAFSPPSPITTLRGAIQMLGIQQVVAIVVGGSGQAMYQVASKADFALFPDLWLGMFKDAMGNAFVAGRIALDVRGASSEKSLLAGLLVDVGRPIALRILSTMIQGGMERPDDAIVMAVLEEVALDVGGRAVSAMGLPEELRSACMPDRNAPTVDAAIAQMIAAIGAVQRRSPRIWVNASEVRHWAEAIKLSPLVVRSVFGQRTTYVEQASAMFGS